MASRSEDTCMITDAGPLADLQARHEAILSEAVRDRWPLDRCQRVGREMMDEVFQAMREEARASDLHN